MGTFEFDDFQLVWLNYSKSNDFRNCSILYPKCTLMQHLSHVLKCVLLF